MGGTNKASTFYKNKKRVCEKINFKTAKLVMNPTRIVEI